MSDLIRRKKICDYIKGEINPYGKQFEGTAYELGLKIMRYIDAMDSAYSVDKVVEELCQQMKRPCCEEDCVNEDDCCENKAFINAFEIVKQGGVRKDVCEWNGEQSRLVTFTRFTTDCGDNIDLQTNSELLKAFRYCPFCGKKIKVMEQMDEEEFSYCHYDHYDDTDEYHDCLDYMECEECPYYYADLDQEVE